MHLELLLSPKAPITLQVENLGFHNDLFPELQGMKTLILSQDNSAQSVYKRLL